MTLRSTEKFVLSFAHLNLRSIFTGFADFVDLVQHEDFDIVGVTETWLTETTSSAVVAIPGFSFYRNDRDQGRGGGVGVYVKSSFQCECLSFSNLPLVEGYEHCWVRIKINRNMSISIGVVYRIGNNVLDCVNILDSLLPELLPIDEYIVVLGDLNINMFNIQNPINNMFDSYGFSQVINEPTRITSTTSTLLDPIFVSDNKIIGKSGTRDSNGVSDHLLTFCTMNISWTKKFEKFLTIRDYRNFDKHLVIYQI